MAPNLREVLFLIATDGSILWSDAGKGPVRLPDSRARWESIWANRDRIAEIAHSHPIGPLAFSREDETTMRALESALGGPIVFSVIAPDGMVRRKGQLDLEVADEPWWTTLLRLASGMPETVTSTNLVRRVAATNDIATKE